MNQKSSPPKRKEPLLHDDNRRRRRIGEVAGGATAECAVMCCCIPVAIINLLILAVYKVPAGLGKKVWRKKKKKRLLKMKMKRRNEIGESGSDGSGVFDEVIDDGVDFDDDEIWDELYGNGFWRVPSQKEEDMMVRLD